LARAALSEFLRGLLDDAPGRKNLVWFPVIRFEHPKGSLDGAVRLNCLLSTSPHYRL